MKTRIVKTVAIVVAGMALVSQGNAQEVTLRVADSFPSGHYIAENLAKKFMAAVNEKTGGKIDFQYFPSEQLGKAADMLSLTVDGVTDIGYVGPSYVSDKLPLSAVAQLPEAFTNSCQGTLAYWELAKPGGILDEVEFKPNGVRLLMAMVLPPYQLVTSSKELTGLDSIRGLKIRATGGAMELVVSSLGGVPVQMAAPEVREALSRGTIDAGLFPHSSILSYEMQTHLKYGTELMNFGSFVATYVISTDRWNSLPDDVKAAMSDVGERATREGCNAADQLDTTDKEKIAQSGVTFGPLSQDETTRINEALSGVGAKWAADLDARGKKGSEILEAFRAAVQAAK